ncbi:MAG: efflux RND transporter periplasmic adaptor subunit [Gammaproteobacteria bacterium]
MNRLALIAVGVLVTLVGGWYVYGLGRNDAELRYSLEAVTRGDVESVVVTTGTLEALNTIVVGSQLSGQIAELRADFNDQVKAGQLIARIDPRTFDARVQQNRADVKVAEATIQQRDAEVLGARATLARAQRELTRRQALKEKGHISESELDADVTAVETAEAQLKMAEAAVVNAKAVLEQRQAALNQAEVDLERTYIHSPVDGTVINRTVEIGQTVAASLQAPELFLIAQDLHQMKVEASVDEADIGRISDGLEVRFSVDAYPDRSFRGTVEQIRKAPDKLQNVVTYRVIISASNRDLALLPGMTANVEVVLGRKEDVLRVPNAALRFVPKDAEVTSAPATAPEAGGRPGPAAMLERLKENLDLTSEQIAELEKVFAEQQERMGELASGGAPGVGGFDPRGAREAMQQARQVMNARIRAVLDPDQRKRFDEMAAARRQHVAGTRPATIWVLEKGKPVPRTVVVGLADDQTTEVVRGLEEGDEVIVRATRSTG